jgi:hypothetical protein
MNLKRNFDGILKHVNKWGMILDDLLITIINMILNTEHNRNLYYSMRVNKHWLSVLQGKKYWNRIRMVRFRCMVKYTTFPLYLQYSQGRKFMCKDLSHVDCCKRMLIIPGELPLNDLYTDSAILFTHWNLIYPRLNSLQRLEICKPKVPISSFTESSFVLPQLKHFLCRFRLGFSQYNWYMWMIKGMPAIEVLWIRFQAVVVQEHKQTEEQLISCIASKSSLTHLNIGFINQTLSSEQMTAFSHLPIKYLQFDHTKEHYPQFNAALLPAAALLIQSTLSTLTELDLSQCYSNKVFLALSKHLSAFPTQFNNLNSLFLTVKHTFSVYISAFSRFPRLKTLSLCMDQRNMIDTIEVLNAIVNIWRSTLLSLDLQFTQSMTTQFWQLFSIGLPILHFTQLHTLTLCFKDWKLDQICHSNILLTQKTQDCFSQVLLSLIDRHTLKYTRIGVPELWLQSIKQRILQARPNKFIQIQ